MMELQHKVQNVARRKHRVRAKVTGTSERPRLSVHISNRHITAQIIDDTTHASLAYVSTVGKKDIGSTMTERAAWTGSKIASLASSAKLTHVVFDRGSRLYHGRVQALAEAAREKGLKF